MYFTFERIFNHLLSILLLFLSKNYFWLRATLRFPTIYSFVLTNINPLKFVVNRLIIRTFVPRNFLYHMSELIALPRWIDWVTNVIWSIHKGDLISLSDIKDELTVKTE